MRLPRLAPLELSEYHARHRTRGIEARPTYWIARGTIPPLILAYFRLRRTGQGNIPKRGGVIIASNHRSFLDPFIVSACVHRPVYYVAKQELFGKRSQGWFLNALGAFPIRRGESDEEAMTTARVLLERGEAVLIFPEGTRTKKKELGPPKRGVGRLALETGVPVVPTVLCGTDRVRRGWRIRPIGLKTWHSDPITFERSDEPSPEAATAATAEIWAAVGKLWAATPPGCKREAAR